MSSGSCAPALVCESITVPLSGACPWHYPPGTFEPEFFEQMKEIRQAALS